MGSNQNFSFSNRYRHILISSLFLIVSSLTQLTSMADGRTISKMEQEWRDGENEKKLTAAVVVMRDRIGSTPPRCVRRCDGCRRCVAVQVPVVPQFNGRKRNHFSSIAYSRGEDISNYKPISWKCKCGDLIFNP